MSEANVEIHELIAWNLDAYPYRSKAIARQEAHFATRLEHARAILVSRSPYAYEFPLLEEETHRRRDLLDAVAQRKALQEEYRGFQWSIGIVDLRRLLAFQRRLVFGPAHSHRQVPQQHNWDGLIEYAFNSEKPIAHRLTRDAHSLHDLSFQLESDNPDLQLRLTQETRYAHSLPLFFYGGCPFFEVAELRGRWFLRDGYHRAYRLLQAGVHCVPAVVLRLRTIEELGATESWFFGESTLFSSHPPQVTDFLNEDLVLRYDRPALRKVIRIRIEESLEA